MVSPEIGCGRTAGGDAVMQVPAALRVEPLFLLALTLAAYLAGVWLQRRTRLAVANPTLIAIVLLGAALRLLHVSYAQYFAGVQFLHFLLGPATVALAVPMVQSLEQLRRGLGPLLVAVAAGSVTGAVSAYMLVRLAGGEQQLALTMLPKSLTTAFGLGVSQAIGGVPSLTAVFAITGGVLVAVCLPLLQRVLKLQDDGAIGLACGAAGGGIGAARVVPMGYVPAAFAGVAIGLNGLITAAIAPALARLLTGL